jgi:hypothetical protein
MLYKFKSRAAGDVIMFGRDGDRALQAMGREPAHQGILLPQDMPAAIAALERVIAQEEAERRQAAEEAEAEGRPLPPDDSVALRQRLWPLIEMLRRCHAADKEITWGT